MKIIHTFGISNMRGRGDNQVLYASGNETFSIGRKYVYPTITDNNHEKGLIMQNLALVWHDADAAYRADFGTYAHRYYSENLSQPNYQLPANSGFAMFLKGMFGWYDSNPEHVDLTAVTVADMVSMDCDMRTVERAIHENFLPGIENDTDLTNDISPTP